MRLRLALILALLLASGVAGAGFFRGGVQGGPTPTFIASVAVTPGTFLGGSADGTSVGAIAVNLTGGPPPGPSPPFTGTLAIGAGGQGTSFRLSSTTLPANLLLNGTQPSGPYTVNIVPTQAGVSNSGTPFPVTITGINAQRIASINPTSGCSFTAGTQNGSVCALTVTMSPALPVSTAALTLTGANSGGFHLVGTGCADISTGTCTIEQSSAVGGTPAGNYTDVSVVATQGGGIGNSPFTQIMLLNGTATPPPTITSIGSTNTFFAAQAGNANTAIGTLSAMTSSGSNANIVYTLGTSAGCTSTDNSKFTTTGTRGTTLAINSVDVTSPVGYDVCVIGTDATFSNSPFPQHLQLTGTGVGGVLTTATYTNYSGSTLPAGTPVSFGQAFRYGDIMPGTHPVIRDASTHTPLAGQQLDEISTWRENGGNGSWRHAVWAAWLPSSVANGASFQVEFVVTAGAYSESSHQAISALCTGPSAHDLKIHLTDVRNQDDTTRDSGDATFRVCDNIANVGRDAPEHTRAGNVYDEYIVKGLPVYTSGHKDPQLYVECIVDIFTKASDGVSAGDVRHVCHNINAWENVGPGSTGNAGNPGPAGFANDPQAISARVEMDDGATDILDWSALDATITSASNPIVSAPGSGGCDSFPSPYCMLVAGSTGAAAWYEGMATRLSCSATCPGGLTNGQLYYVHASGQVGSRSFAAPASQYVALQMVPYGNFTGSVAPGIVNGSQGTGSATFSTHVQMYHTQAWQTLDPTGQDNWAPFGTATRVTRKVYPNFTLAEKQYWEATGAIMPLNLAQTPTVDPGPANAESLFYFPGGPGTVIGGSGVGDRPDLGIVNGYAAAAFINEDQTSWDWARLFSFNASVHGLGAVLLNEATGRIPVLNNGPPVGPGGNGIGNSYPVLGVPQTQTNFQNGFVGLLRPPTTLPNPPGFDIGYGTFNYGTALDHMPSFPGFSYVVFGDRYWLDLMRWRGNAGYLQQRTGPGSELGMGYVRDNNAVFTDGNTYHYYGLMLQCCQERGSAWLRRDITYPATWGSDNDPERAYYADFLKETDNYEPLYEAWVDGPGSTAYRSSMNVPDNQGLGVAPQLFIATYGFDSEWLGLVWQHQPMASRWLTRYQRFLDGCMGGLPNAPVSYYCVDYTMGPAIHTANYGGGSDNGGNLGPGTNGVDAADFGTLPEALSFSIGAGGQITEIPLNMTPPAQIKNIWNWFDEGGTRTGVQIDQLGAGWYPVIGPTTWDGANFIATFYIQCSSADHVAFPAQCPVAGQAFTGFTSGGVPVSGNLGLTINSRPTFDPGPLQGYRNDTYFMYASQMANGLQVAGFNVSHAQADILSREGSNTINLPTGPGWGWDPTVVIPGLPTAVNGAP